MVSGFSLQPKKGLFFWVPFKSPNNSLLRFLSKQRDLVGFFALVSFPKPRNGRVGFGWGSPKLGFVGPSFSVYPFVNNSKLVRAPPLKWSNWLSSAKMLLAFSRSNSPRRSLLQATGSAAFPWDFTWEP